MEKIKVLIIAGPTASGKSDLAIRLARRFNGEIVSADSRQVYAGMDLGTGKVVRDAVSRIPYNVLRAANRYTKYAIRSMYFSEGIRHWLLDVASPKRQYSVARWKWAAQHAIRDIARRSKVPIICGGTGFWIDALVYDLVLPEVKPDAKLRARLQKLSPVQLFAHLKKLDPARAATIDQHNPRRLIRALEIVLTTGQSVPPRIQSSPYEPLYLGIAVPKEVLVHRIAKRLDARLKVGMINEVRRLHDRGTSWKRLENFGLEYRWIARYLRSELKVKNEKLKMKNRIPKTFHFSLETLNLQHMRSYLLRDIVRYAKRQLTWFRRNPDIHWVTRSTSPTTGGPAHALRLARQFLAE